MSASVFNIASKTTPRIAYTVGEPAGIGADIILHYAAEFDMQDIVCIGDPRAISARAALMGLSDVAAKLTIIDVPVQQPTACGTPDVDNTAGVLAMLDRAIDGCMAGEFAAMVTGPLHKGIINDAGVVFSGHTEYLGQRTNAAHAVMLLVSGDLRVALVTTHLPLRAVSDAITGEAIIRIASILHHDLKLKFGITKPNILVCGLNPHAGEGGHLGREEIDIIEPAVRQLRERGITVTGPVPADTAFTPESLRGIDVVLAMYHDQGLPVLKALSFGAAANVTLGLPIVRTSVDHGTALDIAGTGKAQIGGLQTAINTARAIVAAQAAASSEAYP